MSYTTVEKVKALFRDISIDTDTAVTISEVEDLIEEVDVEIDSKLSDFYEVPIVGAKSLVLIGKISRLKVAHMVKTILESTAELSDRVNQEQTNLDLKAEKLLNDIIPKWDEKCCEWVDPIIQLPDAVRKPMSPKSGNVFKSNKAKPEIKRFGRNW